MDNISRKYALFLKFIESSLEIKSRDSYYFDHLLYLEICLLNVLKSQYEMSLGFKNYIHFCNNF